VALKSQIIGGNHAGDGGSFRLKIDRDEIRSSLAAAYRHNPTTVKRRRGRSPRRRRRDARFTGFSEIPPQCRK